MSGDFPKMEGPILTYISNQMGPTANFSIDLVGTFANLQVYAR